MKFDANPDRKMLKQVSESSPSYAAGGNYTTPKQGAGPAKPQAIVTSGTGGGDWAKGGGESSVGKQSVKPAYPC